MVEHELKLHPKYFDDVKTGKKNFEVRYNDRGFKVGDILFLNEYDNGFYTGRILKRKITYVLDSFRGVERKLCCIGD